MNNAKPNFEYDAWGMIKSVRYEDEAKHEAVQAETIEEVKDDKPEEVSEDKPRRRGRKPRV